MAVAEISIRPTVRGAADHRQARQAAGEHGPVHPLAAAVRWAASLMVMPLAYMISTSLKWPHEVYNLNLIPEEPTLENYTYVLEDGRFYWWFLNSLIIATITTISNVLFDSLVGYTLCKFRFPGPLHRLHRDPVDADDPDRDAGDPVVSDEPAVRLARHLLGHHVPRADDRLRHLPDEAVLRDRARRFHRGRAHRRAERVADLVDGGHAAGQARRWRRWRSSSSSATGRPSSGR